MKRKMVFISSGNSLNYDAVYNKYSEQMRKLKEHYDIIPIDELYDSHQKYYETLKILTNMDVIVKDMTMSAYGRINNIGYVNRDNFPPKEGVETFIMSGDIQNFQELFDYLYIN